MKKPKNQDFLVPDNIYDIMRQCWNSQPVRRPTYFFLGLFILGGYLF
jgi:hypothetical protein